MLSSSSTDENRRGENHTRKVIIRLFSQSASISLTRFFFQVFTSSSVKTLERGGGGGTPLYKPL